MRDALIHNSVKMMEWKMTQVLRREIGESIEYDWLQNPIRALRGKEAEFVLVEQRNIWAGKVKCLPDGRLRISIKLNKIRVDNPIRKEERSILLID